LVAGDFPGNHSNYGNQNNHGNQNRLGTAPGIVRFRVRFLTC
jgi:hypothetical protein